MIPHDAEQVSRETLEQVARIIGPHSGAARALEDADKHGGPVVFLRTRGTILVLRPTTPVNGGEG